MMVKFDGDSEIVVEMPINPKKFREQILNIKIEEDELVFMTVKQIHKDHWKINERHLGFDDFIIQNEAIRKINSKRK